MSPKRLIEQPCWPPLYVVKKKGNVNPRSHSVDKYDLCAAAVAAAEK